LPDSRAIADDFVRPFQIERVGVRGRLVRCGPAIDAIIQRHRYPEPVAGLLGEAASLAALLAGALKYDGIFTLQTKGDGPVRLLVADVTSAGAVRAYAQFDAEAMGTFSAGARSVPRLLGAGYLAFTVDQGEHTERYQGLVELQGANLADCAHHYFRQSEQIEAVLRVAAAQDETGQWRAGGIMLQRLPPEGGTGIESRLSIAGEEATEVLDDGWRRVVALLGSCSSRELTDSGLDADALLYRLFHEEGVRVFPTQPILDRCRCSRERVEATLGSLPEDDLRHLEVDGKIAVTCEFCSREYVFSDAELSALYPAAH
jgi:molecular chaperone Hsp33